MVREQIEKYLIANAGISPEKLSDPAMRMADLGLDSLGVVEMLFEIEDKYGFRVEDVMAYNTMTFAEVVADLERQVMAKGVVQNPDGGLAPAAAAA